MNLLSISLLLISSPFLGVSGQCNYSIDGYSLEWQVEGTGSSANIFFALKYKFDAHNFWTGIGFGPGMNTGDYSIIQVIDGGVRLVDMWSNGHGSPNPDDRNDITDLGIDVIDDVLQANFSRPMMTEGDQDVSLNGCVTFMFPHRPGGMDKVGRMYIHHKTPVKLEYCDLDIKCQRPLQGHKFKVVIPTKEDGGSALFQVSPLGESKTFTTNSIVASSPQIIPSAPRSRLRAPNQDSCTYKSNDYTAVWEYEPTSKMVTFNIRARQTDPTNENWWSGVGFGRGMSDGDFVLITVVRGELTISDRTYNPANPYSEPLVDNQVNVQFLKGGIEDGWVQVSFTRPLISPDKQDVALDGCQYLMFPTNGGPIYFDGRLGPHFSVPIIHRVCSINQCIIQTPEDSPQQEIPQNTNTSPQLPPFGCVKEDNILCAPYFQQYLKRVDEFAHAKGLTPQSQYPKACSLLASVQNGIVPTECCISFSQKCA